MLIEGRCSIYEYRPRTCRTYDCRIFPATAVEVDDGRNAQIARQARRWRFAFPTQADRDRQHAVRAAVRFLGRRKTVESDGGAALSPRQLAVRAIEIHDAFLGSGEKADRAPLVAHQRRR